MKDSIEIPVPEIVHQSSEFEIKNLKKNLNPKSKSSNRIKTFNYNNNDEENAKKKILFKKPKFNTK